MVILHPADILYQRVKPEDVAEIVEQSLLRGEVIERLLYRPGHDSGDRRHATRCRSTRSRRAWCSGRTSAIEPTASRTTSPPAATRRSPRPSSPMTPERGHRGDQEVRAARARRRRASPRARKWESAARQRAGRRALRHLQRRRGRPGRLHGPLRARGEPALGARGHDHRRLCHRRHEGYVYVRNEYPLAVEHIALALRPGRGATASWARTSSARGLDFAIKVVRGAGAFVCGESTRPDGVHRGQGRRAAGQVRAHRRPRACATGRPTSTTSRPGPTCP